MFSIINADFVSSTNRIFHFFFQFSADSQIEHWRTKASEFKAKYDKTKQLYQLSLKNNFEKDLKISKMQHQLTHTSQLPAAEHLSTRNQLLPVVNESHAAYEINEVRQSSLKEAHKFDSFQNDFEDAELAKLRSIDDDGDTTFIRLGLSFLYKSNLAALSNRSVTGTFLRVKRIKIDDEVVVIQYNGTEPLTPIKRNILCALFGERVEKSNGGESEKLRRKKKFPQMLAKAICYLRET